MWLPKPPIGLPFRSDNDRAKHTVAFCDNYVLFILFWLGTCLLASPGEIHASRAAQVEASFMLRSSLGTLCKALFDHASPFESERMNRVGDLFDGGRRFPNQSYWWQANEKRSHMAVPECVI